MGTGLTSGLMALLIAFVLGFGAAWIWRGKRLTFLEGQTARLRRDRRTLAHRLSQANGRLDSANYNRAKIEENAAKLRARHDALESEHAQLVVNYANLKSGVKGIVGEDDWFEDYDSDLIPETAEPAAQPTPTRRSRPTQRPAQQPTQRPSKSPSARPAERPARQSSEAAPKTAPKMASAPGPQDKPTQEAGAKPPRAAKSLDDSLMADTATLTSTETDAPDSLSGPTTISAPIAPTEEPDTLAVSQRKALKDLEAFEAQLSAASRSIGDERPFIGTQDFATPGENTNELREQLSRQQAEITRLQEQLGPLLGLPLAVSAREAERDRLAERLAAREREMNEMITALDQLARSERELREEMTKLRKKGEQKSQSKNDKKKKRKKEFTQTAQHAALRPPGGLATDHLSGSMSPATDHGINDHATLANGAGDSGERDTLISNALPWRDIGVQQGVDAHGQDLNAVGNGQTQPVQAGAPRQYQQAPDQVDNLKEIKGIGPVLERMLNQLGVYQFRQIASWSKQDVAYFDDHLADFRGRIVRDDWVSGAQLANARKNR